MALRKIVRQNGAAQLSDRLSPSPASALGAEAGGCGLIQHRGLLSRPIEKKSETIQNVSAYEGFVECHSAHNTHTWQRDSSHPHVYEIYAYPHSLARMPRSQATALCGAPMPAR